MNDTQEKYNFDVDVTNVYKTVQKYTENHENANECIEKPQSKCWWNIKIKFGIKDKSDLDGRVLKNNIHIMYHYI